MKDKKEKIERFYRVESLVYTVSAARACLEKHATANVEGHTVENCDLKSHLDAWHNKAFRGKTGTDALAKLNAEAKDEDGLEHHPLTKKFKAVLTSAEFARDFFDLAREEWAPHTEIGDLVKRLWQQPPRVGATGTAATASTDAAPAPPTEQGGPTAGAAPTEQEGPTATEGATAAEAASPTSTEVVRLLSTSTEEDHQRSKAQETGTVGATRTAAAGKDSSDQATLASSRQQRQLSPPHSPSQSAVADTTSIAAHQQQLPCRGGPCSAAVSQRTTSPQSAGQEASEQPTAQSPQRVRAQIPAPAAGSAADDDGTPQQGGRRVRKKHRGGRNTGSPTTGP